MLSSQDIVLSHTWRAALPDATLSADWRWKMAQAGAFLTQQKATFGIFIMLIDIRPLVKSDQSDWRRLWTAYLEFYESSVAEDIYETTFQRLLSEDHPDQNGLIALSNGGPVGLVHYIYHPHNWRIEDVCYLQDLYADLEIRGQGVGRKLIEAVYAAADAKGCPSVYWLTQDFNAEARKLYDRIATLTPFIKYNR